MNPPERVFQIVSFTRCGAGAGSVFVPIPPSLTGQLEEAKDRLIKFATEIFHVPVLKTQYSSEELDLLHQSEATETSSHSYKLIRLSADGIAATYGCIYFKILSYKLEEAL
jgi:hypothetical protein